MRLHNQHRQAIKSAVEDIVGAGCQVWLFGSRADDSKRGGDIDLLIETAGIVPNRVTALCRLEGRLVRVLGDRKIDVLLKDARTADAPIHRVARETGVQL